MEKSYIKYDKVKFQYHISYKDSEQIKEISFRSKKKMIDYLNKNKKELNKLAHVFLHFKAIKLSLKSSVWNDRN